MQFRDAIEEKVRNEYPDIPKTYKLEPSNIERSTLKGYDLDFPVRTKFDLKSNLKNSI